MSRTRRPPDVSNAESSPQFVEAGPPPPVSSSTYDASGYRHDAVPAWLAPVFQGITIVIFIGFAFWFGALSKTVEQTAKTVEELRASQERMFNRLIAIETKQQSMETKLDSVDRKLDQVTKHGR